MTYSNLGSSSLGAPYEPYVSYEKKEPVVKKSESFENFEGLERNDVELIFDEMEQINKKLEKLVSSVNSLRSNSNETFSNDHFTMLDVQIFLLIALIIAIVLYFLYSTFFADNKGVIGGGHMPHPYPYPYPYPYQPSPYPYFPPHMSHTSNLYENPVSVNS